MTAVGALDKVTRVPAASYLKSIKIEKKLCFKIYKYERESKNAYMNPDH